ncbi:hypothetical protein QE385_002701 [Sphingomonas sp. SORGH_AS 950]|uniref:hypothetical protein n=1 Tax=Sphingomonas sp. SORGH_AS_0950 TaxID=3041792 RepID=UPI0027834C32|nr:hypothetical protein [Sphingomonas sp. SORGH_AS_0950]MDQ1158374.1 hypothetical protein [Sphingomonas sp. SORGH_AS_0950]
MALSRPHDARVSLSFPSWAPVTGDVMAWVATYALAMAIFFRRVIASGFDLGFGERGDALIEMTILEHWRNVLSGVSPWDAAFYFHPYGGSLGYNDGYFLYGLSYSVWRLVADPFHADTLNILTFKTIGFAAAYHLVKRTLDWGRGSALLVALLWSIASNIHLQAVHAQLQSVALLPVAMILAIGCVRAEGRGDGIAARWRAVALAALMAAWLLTSYYMAWFTIFSACLFVLCWAMLSGNARPAALAGLVRRHGGTLAWGGGAFAVLILPFLAVYLPKLRETGGEGYYEMLGYLVTPGIDMINVGPGNYLWGWLFRPLFSLLHALFPDDPLLPGRVLGGEHEAGFPPLLCALLLVAAWRIVVRRRIGIAGEAPGGVARLCARDDRRLGADAAILGGVALEPRLLAGAGSQGAAHRVALSTMAEPAVPADRPGGVARAGGAAGGHASLVAGGDRRLAGRRESERGDAQPDQPCRPSRRAGGHPRAASRLRGLLRRRDAGERAALYQCRAQRALSAQCRCDVPGGAVAGADDQRLLDLQSARLAFRRSKGARL